MQHSATEVRYFSAIRAVLGVLVSLVLLAGCTGFFVIKDFRDQLSENIIDISDFDKGGTTDEEKPPGDPFAGKALNILVSGIDSRLNADYAYGDPDKIDTIRSDTTMIVHISQDRSRVQVVSIPRDLMTTIPSCQSAEGYETYEHYGQFNSAFADGAGKDDIAGGIACTKATVELLTGLELDGFVVVDFAGFAHMVDALGGVWFDVPSTIENDDSNICFDPGCQHLDGRRALDYARVRYGVEDSDGSDLERIGRQQALVGVIFNTLLSKNFITDMPALLSFLKQTLAALKMSSEFADITDDAGLLMSLASISRENIQFLMMPNTPDDYDPNRVVAVEPDATEVWNALANDEPYPPGSEYRDGNGVMRTVPYPEGDGQSSDDSSGAFDDSDNTEIDGGNATNEAPGPDLLSEDLSDESAESTPSCPPTGH